MHTVEDAKVWKGVPQFLLLEEHWLTISCTWFGDFSRTVFIQIVLFLLNKPSLLLGVKDLSVAGSSMNKVRIGQRFVSN